MRKIILIISLIAAIVLHAYYYLTGDETVLALELLALLASFTCSMMLLANK